MGEPVDIGLVFSVKLARTGWRPQCWSALIIPHFKQEGGLAMSTKTLYERLGGYDAIVAVSSKLLPRLMSDSRLKRFWEHRGEDGIAREKQLLIDFLCANSGGPMYYTGRDMKVSHKGMKINEADWTAFMGHVNATLDVFKLPPTERGEVVGFVQSLKKDIVEV
jgi:hemoglobin